MKNKIFVLALSLALVGCMQSKEHLILQDNGSGTFEYQLILPQGTIQLLEATLGGFVKMMSKSFGKDAEEKAPKSVVDEMFGNKDGIIKKANSSGVKIEFAHFDSHKKEDGLHVNYKITFDNITKLLASGIVSTKIDIVPGSGAQWTCLLKADPKKAEESKGKLNQFEDFKKSEMFTGMDPAQQAAIMEAINNLDVEFLISMPYAIDTSSGAFEKVNETTARLSLKGSFLEDPALIEKMYGMMGEESKVVWNTANTQQIQEVHKQTLQLKESYPLTEPEPVVKEEPPVIVQEPQVPIDIDEDLEWEQEDAIPIEDIETDVQVIDVQPGVQNVDSQVQVVNVAPKEDASVEQQAPPEGTVKIYTKDGEVVSGVLLEETDDAVKIDFDGIPLTYFREDIDRVE